MRVLVVYCHPNPASLTAAALDRVRAGLRRRRHDVRCTDLYADGFRPELSADEQRDHLVPGLAPDIAGYADDLRWAEAVVFVYPTWWSGQPAMLKGWIDRVCAHGVAWSLPEPGGTPVPLLTGLRRVVIVTTHGSPKLVNLLEGETGRRTMFRSMRRMAGGRVRTTWIALYGLDRITAARRTAWLDRVEREIAKL
jgi:NAD(P)H dehydrogenase (quinone)